MRLTKIIILCLSLNLGACATTENDVIPHLMKDGIVKAQPQIEDCKKDKQTGIFTTYVQSSRCINAAIREHILPHAPYPHLVKEYMNYREQTSHQLDRGNVTYDEWSTLIESKRKSLVQKGVEIHDQALYQQWYAYNLEHNAFNKNHCQFDIFGVPKCMNW